MKNVFITLGQHLKEAYTYVISTLISYAGSYVVGTHRNHILIGLTMPILTTTTVSLSLKPLSGYYQYHGILS